MSGLSSGQDSVAEAQRVFALQQAHQWNVKASIAAQRKAKLAQLKAAVEEHADAIVAAVLEDSRKPDAIEKGASIAAGGTLEASDLTINPTMLTDVTPQMTILQQEIFAHVLPVMTYETIGQMIDYICARDKPLALCIYSQNAASAEKILSRTSSGGVTVNGVFSQHLENQLPFGGVNQSGMGSYHGVFGFRAFSHERAVYRHQA